MQAYLTIPEVADRLRICRASVYTLIARGILPRPVKFGHSSRISLAELAAAERALAAQVGAR